MKTWKTIALSVITTSTLVTAGALTYSYLQPSHYKGDTFTNAKTSVSSTTSSTSSSSSNSSTSSNDSNTNTNPIYTESNSTEVENNYSQETNNNSTQVEQNTGDRAYQPTFKVECVSPKNDLYCVEHIPTGDKTKAITYEQADAFCKYMEQIAYGKTSLSHTMDENYNTWNGDTEQQSSETNE